jgi:simple sugar transport system permease protein
MATTALRREIELVSPTRQRVMGVIFLLLAFGIWFLFSRDTSADAITTFGLTTGGAQKIVQDLKLPSNLILNILAFVCAFMGTVQLVRANGFGRRTNLVLGIVAGLFIFGFLTWAAAEISNLAGLLNTRSPRQCR